MYAHIILRRAFGFTLLHYHFYFTHPCNPLNMNVVTMGERLMRRTRKDFDTYMRQCQDLAEEPTLTYDQFLERNRRHLVECAVQGQITINAMKDRMHELGLIADKVTSTFSITIRPDEARITFDAFFMLIQKLMKRACFVHYTLSFEQKGTTQDTLGQGFHVHIVAKMKQTNRAQVARDVHNTVKDCCEFQCVDVRVAKTPDTFIQNYLIEYMSEDGHKEVTKEWDGMWRVREGLLPLYKNDVPARIVPLA